MKIVTFDELCALPKGTIFAAWEPCVHSELMRLGEIIRDEESGAPRDYFYCDVASFTPNGCGPCVSNVEGRWGLYDYDERYLVWESEDVARMIRILTGADTEEDNLWPDAPIPNQFHSKGNNE